VRALGGQPLAVKVAIAIRDQRCFPAGPARDLIYLPFPRSRERHASVLSWFGAFSVVVTSAATASVVFAALDRDPNPRVFTELGRQTASVYRQAEIPSFVDRWGDAEFTVPSDEEEPVFYTKSIRTVSIMRSPQQQVPLITAAIDRGAATERPHFPVAFSLASVDSRQVDIDQAPPSIIDKDLVGMDEVSQYLWEVYQRQPTKKDGAGDFTWKDPAAAKRMGISMPKYVIGGMDPDFREQLYHAGKAMDAAGLKWSILSAFRDDYRQRIASGIKAAPSNSLHGGMARTGGYGHGRAVDITNAEGDMDEVWDWIDDHGAKYGLHRPMPGYDPAHIQSTGDWRKLAVSLRKTRVNAAKVAKASSSSSE